MKANLEYLVNKMNANGDSFSPFIGLKGWQNIEADEATFPVVFFDMPIKSKVTVLAGGHLKRVYILVALFLYKSEQDSDENQDFDYYEKARKAEENFILLLENEKDIVRSWSIQEDYQIPHEFDGESSGVVLPFSVEFRNENPVCLT